MSQPQATPNPFFDHPILNSPYAPPARHWELDAQGQPTQRILETRRRADFITPIPKPKKRRIVAAQEAFVFDEGHGLSTKEQHYDPTSIINEVRNNVDAWRALPNPSQWQVTPETARLLEHWFWRLYPPVSARSGRGADQALLSRGSRSHTETLGCRSRPPCSCSKTEGTAKEN